LVTLLLCLDLTPHGCLGLQQPYFIFVQFLRSTARLPPFICIHLLALQGPNSTATSRIVFRGQKFSLVADPLSPSRLLNLANRDALITSFPSNPTLPSPYTPFSTGQLLSSCLVFFFSPPLKFHFYAPCCGALPAMSTDVFFSLAPMSKS